MILRIIRHMRIEKISDKDSIPYSLLLLADETTDAVNKYIHDSDIYIAKENTGDEPIAVYVLQQVNEVTVEIKNIAVSETFQNRGIGRLLMNSIIAQAKEGGYREVIVGTAGTGARQLRFYEKNGFKVFGIKKDFFINNYPQPIYEHGIQLRDMAMLRREI